MKITLLSKALSVRIYTSRTSRYEIYVSLVSGVTVRRETYEYTNHRGREVWG